MRTFPKLLLGLTLPSELWICFQVHIVPRLASDQRTWPYYYNSGCVWWGLPAIMWCPAMSLSYRSANARQNHQEACLHSHHAGESTATVSARTLWMSHPTYKWKTTGKRWADRLPLHHGSQVCPTWKKERNNECWHLWQRQKNRLTLCSIYFRLPPSHCLSFWRFTCQTKHGLCLIHTKKEKKKNRKQVSKSEVHLCQRELFCH